MSAVQLFPDTEAAVKTAAKVALPVLGGRVFYSLPESYALPVLTVAQVSGGPQNTEAPIEQPRLTFSCWGKDKLDASDLRRALVGWLRSLTDVQLDDTTWCYGVADIFATWQPDDDARLARYVVDATFTVTVR